MGVELYNYPQRMMTSMLLEAESKEAWRSSGPGHAPCGLCTFQPGAEAGPFWIQVVEDLRFLSGVKAGGPCDSWAGECGQGEMQGSCQGELSVLLRPF